MAEQVKLYHKYQPLVREGDYYRIASARENHEYDCWAVAAKDGSEALVTFVQTVARANYHSRRIRLAGLKAGGRYRLEETGEVYAGETLMLGGILVEPMMGDYRGKLMHFTEVQ